VVLELEANNSQLKESLGVGKNMLSHTVSLL